MGYWVKAVWLIVVSAYAGVVCLHTELQVQLSISIGIDGFISSQPLSAISSVSSTVASNLSFIFVN